MSIYAISFFRAGQGRTVVDYTKRAKAVLDIEIAGLAKVRNNIDKDFNKAIKIMLDCVNQCRKIIVTGVGKNLHVAEKISSTLLSTGTLSVTLNPTQAIHGDLGMLTAGDVLLALSYSGESEEILAIIPAVKRAGLRIVALTGSPGSALAKHSDAMIKARVHREACPFNMAPTTSTTATMALGDAIAMILLETRGFRKEDYAKLHPGGAIGRTLFLRVSDIMRTGNRLAIVRKTDRVKNLVLAMTSARAGSAAVVDGKNRLVGIVTDGDIRRRIAGNGNLLEKKVCDIMTPSPVSITPDRLAVEALRFFEERNIDDIIVVDSRKRVVGAIDIQDLPKLKIM